MNWRWWPPTPAPLGVDLAALRRLRRRLMPDLPPGVRGWQRFLVYDHVWRAAGMGPVDGGLCIPCLEHRLGWPLTGEDLPPLPLNDLDADLDTHRLAELKHPAAQRNATAAQRRRRPD